MDFWKTSFFLIIMAALSACSGSQTASSANTASGQQLFVNSCSTCHGPAGEGITGLGKPLTSSSFIAAMSDAELLAFIKNGRSVDDPLNTTGIAMPPKGGNPALTDEQLQAIVAHLRSIQTTKS